MSGFQFIHLEAYSLTGSKGYPGDPKGKTKTARAGKQARLSIQQVIDEALRKPGACLHVPNPQTPTMIYGDANTFEFEIADLQQRATNTKDSLGRKLRKDKLLLLAGVASYPVPTTLLDETDERFLDWEGRTEEYLRARWGDQLKAIIYHRDEAFPHIHFYVLPDDLDMASIHPGVKAGQEAPPNGSKQAYNTAMREFQDDYFEQVAQHVGLTRLGPRRRRLSRGEWKAEQAVATLTVDCLKRQQEELSNARERLALERKQFNFRRSAVALERDQLTTKAERLAKETKENQTIRSLLILKESSIVVHAIETLRQQKGETEVGRLRCAIDAKDREIATLRSQLAERDKRPDSRDTNAPEGTWWGSDGPT